jgi:hypothetical protein
MSLPFALSRIYQVASGSDAFLMIGDHVAPISRAWRRSSFPRPYI